MYNTFVDDKTCSELIARQSTSSVSSSERQILKIVVLSCDINWTNFVYDFRKTNQVKLQRKNSGKENEYPFRKAKDVPFTS